MKNQSIIFVLFAFCVLSFSSCKKEEELSTREKIIGKWTVKSLQNDIYNENKELIDSYTREFAATTEYKANGRFETIDSTNISQVWMQTGTWEVINDTIISMTYKTPGIEGIHEDSITSNITRIIEEITSNRLVHYTEGEARSNATGEIIRIRSTTTLTK